MLMFIKKFIPTKIFNTLSPTYHRMLVVFGILVYRQPSKKIKIAAVTGTKGKSSVCEFINSILESSGQKTALASTIRFKIGDENNANKLKMTMPGRFFMHRFLRKAVNSKCDWAIIEMTSEGTKQFRHIGIHIDALVFTNIAREHIEAHGSFEKYVEAKFKIGNSLVKSKKRPRLIVANEDDEYGTDFLSLKVEESYPYGLDYAKPYSTDEEGSVMTFMGVNIASPIPGTFTISNMLAAAVFAKAIQVDMDHIKTGLENVTLIPGRVERVDEGQDFDVVVDYAHTVESLESLYQAFPRKKKICVLGNTGGGRDTWKRPKMAAVAEKYCEEVILTNEDPYDEDPKAIIDEMAGGMNEKPKIIMDRKSAINAAISSATKSDVVLITGKGTDPYIMEANNKKTPWSDSKVAREELKNIIERADTI